MKTYKTLLHALFAVISGLLLTGCDVVFINPLLDPQKAVMDKRLIGTWHIQDATAPGDIKLEQAGQKVRVAAVTSKKFKDKLPREFYTLACADKNFIVAAYQGRVGKKTYPGYMVIRYKIEHDALQVLLANPAQFKAALQAGQLRGQAGAAFASTIIAAPAQQALQFLCAADDNLFEYLGEVKRVGGASSDQRP